MAVKQNIAEPSDEWKDIVYHKYNDDRTSYECVRRWKVAEGQNDPEHWIYPAYHTGGEGGKVYGMNMDKDYPAFFERTSFETRVAFTKKQYFMPIPYDDLRRIPSLVQNLGW